MRVGDRENHGDGSALNQDLHEDGPDQVSHRHWLAGSEERREYGDDYQRRQSEIE